MVTSELEKIEELEELERKMKITRLIGLGEAQRKIYENLEKNNQLEHQLKDAYGHHEAELKSLIEYQNQHNNS